MGKGNGQRQWAMGDWRQAMGDKQWAMGNGQQEKEKEIEKK